VNARRIIALYPRKWRERYGEEISALVEDRQASFRDSVDLIANCLREWERTLPLGRILFPMAVGFVANAIGWFLRDRFGRLAVVDNAFPGVLGAWIAIWVLVCGRLMPSYWRWLTAPLHRQPPPFPKLSVVEGRCVLAMGMIVSIVVPWNTDMPREWWSFMSNPSVVMLATFYSVMWPLQNSEPYASTIESSKRPPNAPLGLA
jgi:hypothetical protein